MRSALMIGIGGVLLFVMSCTGETSTEPPSVALTKTGETLSSNPMNEIEAENNSNSTKGLADAKGTDGVRGAIQWKKRRISIDLSSKKTKVVQNVDFLFKALIKGSRIHELILAHSDISSKGMDVVCSLPDLDSLNLSGTNLTKSDFAKVSNLLHLKTFGAEFTKIGDESLVGFKDMKSLRTLNLSITGIGDKGIKYIHSLELRVLLIGETQITDKGLAVIGDMSTIEVLDISGIRTITDEGIKALKNMPSLKVLDVSRGFGFGRSAKITDKSLQFLSGLKNLRSLKLRGTALTKRAVERFIKENPRVKVDF